jgi:hypothetical protein
MNPSPEQLELTALLLRNPLLRWEYRNLHDDGGVWHKCGITFGPWHRLSQGCLLRLDPDFSPKPEPKWSIHKTVPTLLEYKDADGATKFGAIQKQDEERVWFFNFGSAHVLDKETGEVTRLDP